MSASPVPVTERCQLLRVVGSAGSGALVALHDEGGDVRQLVELCEAAAPHLRHWCVQAPRARNALLGAPAPSSQDAYRGFSWFRADDAGRPEPHSFADALGQLLALALEIEAAPRILLGLGKGGTLALAAASIAPDVWDGVISLGGPPPDVPGYTEGSVRSPRRCVLDAPARPADAAPQVADWLRRLRSREWERPRTRR